jgi:hypothetical protein
VKREAQQAFLASVVHPVHDVEERLRHEAVIFETEDQDEAPLLDDKKALRVAGRRLNVHGLRQVRQDELGAELLAHRRRYPRAVEGLSPRRGRNDDGTGGGAGGHEDPDGSEDVNSR